MVLAIEAEAEIMEDMPFNMRMNLMCKGEVFDLYTWLKLKVNCV